MEKKTEYFKTIPVSAGNVVGACVYNNTLYIACSHRVYKLLEGKLCPVLFVEPSKEDIANAT